MDTKKKNAKRKKKMKCMQGDLDGSRGVETGVERTERRQMQVSRRYQGTNQRHKNRISIDRGLLNSFSTPLILLHELSFTCFASFFYLCVHSILFLFFLYFYGSLFSSFPLCQFSVCLLSSLLAFYAL